MNNIFDFRRFGWYARKEFSENWKALALGIVASMALTAFTIYGRWQEIHNTENVVVSIETSESLLVMLALGIMFASSYVWRAFSNKKDTFSALTLPVSVLERFLFAWLVAVPLVALVSFVVSQTMWSLATPYFLRDFPKLIVEPVLQYSDHSSPPDNYGFVFYLCAPAVFMWGALTLGRLNFLKTLGISILAGILFLWLQDKHLAAIFPNVFDVSSGFPFPIGRPFINIQTTKEVFANNLVSTFEGVYGIWWIFIVPLVLYASIYLKLKEKEI